MDAYDAIIKLFLKEEMEAKKVYKGDESIGRRALRRVLIRSRLDSMLASIREEMVYNAPPELGSLWSKFEAMWKQINEEQEIARAEELRKAQIAAWQRARTINKAKALATWIGAILFVQVWMWALMVMIRKSQTYQSLSSYVWQ
jgi:ferric-dicitrate binding protein FerR (iron transport regulator)